MSKKAHIPNSQISLASEYFLCMTTAQNNQQSLMHYTVLHRTQSPDGKYLTTIVHDSINDW
jgi:hypothetical protein